MRGVSRTNVDVDDEALERVMNFYGFETKRDAINFALRKVAPKLTTEQILTLEGSGWEGDLEEMRSGWKIEEID